MKILVINCGSSSLKYQLIDMDGEKVLCKGLCERIGMESSMITHEANGHKATTPAIFPTHTEAFGEVVKKMTTGEGKVIDNVNEIDAIGHRVVHGGEKFKQSCLITPDVVKAIHDLSPLAPLHNPAAILGIEASYKVFGEDKPNIAVFDTAFHSTMPSKAYMYAIPYEYYEKYGVRRYGFHGTSHRYVSQRVCEMLGVDIRDKKIITCHIGNGASITAVDGGKSVDTSMGLTPTEGLMMGTRVGDVDPGALVYLMERRHLNPEQLQKVIQKESGMLGVTEISNDMREIEAAVNAGNERARLGLEMYEQRIIKYIGAYAAEMGGVDIIVFTGGVGENQTGLRADVCRPLAFMGVEINEQLNAGIRGTETVISTPASKVIVAVVPTDEELTIARDTRDIVNKL